MVFNSETVWTIQNFKIRIKLLITQIMVQLYGIYKHIWYKFICFFFGTKPRPTEHLLILIQTDRFPAPRTSCAGFLGGLFHANQLRIPNGKHCGQPSLTSWCCSAGSIRSHEQSFGFCRHDVGKTTCFPYLSHGIVKKKNTNRNSRRQERDSIYSFWGVDCDNETNKNYRKKRNAHDSCKWAR